VHSNEGQSKLQRNISPPPPIFKVEEEAKQEEADSKKTKPHLRFERDDRGHVSLNHHGIASQKK
jgi:hypothetical protein